MTFNGAPGNIQADLTGMQTDKMDRFVLILRAWGMGEWFPLESEQLVFNWYGLDSKPRVSRNAFGFVHLCPGVFHPSIHCLKQLGSPSPIQPKKSRSKTQRFVLPMNIFCNRTQIPVDKTLVWKKNTRQQASQKSTHLPTETFGMPRRGFDPLTYQPILATDLSHRLLVVVSVSNAVPYL